MGIEAKSLPCQVLMGVYIPIAPWESLKLGWKMNSFSDQDPRLDGVCRIPGAPGCSNVYVLQGGSTLIDAGNMFGLVEEIGGPESLENLRRILFTHSHFDHVGGVSELYQYVTPEVFMHQDARECLRFLQPPFPEFFEALDSDGRLKVLRNGEPVEGVATLRAVHTPGHTAGDLCFFDDRSGAIFCGDGIPPKQDGRGFTPWEIDEECGGSLVAAVRSLRRLLDLPIEHVFPGHGEPILHYGGDHVKVALFTLHKRIHQGDSKRAWLAMASDLLAVGLDDEARQCVCKATGLPRRALEVGRIIEELRSTAVPRD